MAWRNKDSAPKDGKQFLIYDEVYKDFSIIYFNSTADKFMQECCVYNPDFNFWHPLPCNPNEQINYSSCC